MTGLVVQDTYVAGVFSVLSVEPRRLELVLSVFVSVWWSCEPSRRRVIVSLGVLYAMLPLNCFSGVSIR